MSQDGKTLPSILARGSAWGCGVFVVCRGYSEEAVEGNLSYSAIQPLSIYVCIYIYIHTLFSPYTPK